MEYNLIDEPWIPVLYHDGRWERVGIRRALLEAGEIRQIAASNPMDRVALLRFLLAMLMWCKQDAKSSLAVIEDKNTSIPEDWLAKLKEHKTAFNLLGGGKRFYQDELMKDKESRPIGDLLVEFPTETKIAHFRHVRDKGYGLCPACCALGIIRFCGWANAYGGGRYTSAVNGPTPAYAIPQDSTLLRTLLLNWPTNGAPNREPPWICADPPKANGLDSVTVFAWRSRRLWLGDPDESKDRCSYCGKIDKLIRQHAFTGNWKPPFQTSGNNKKFWDQDPHLIFEEKSAAGDDGQGDNSLSDANAAVDQDSTGDPRTSRKKKKDKPKVLTTLGFPSPSASVTSHTRFWRRALSARLASNSTEHETASITVTGPAANKGLYQDATSVSLPRDCRPEPIEAVSKAVESLSSILRSKIPNPQRQHPERRAALDALSPSLEARLRQGLNACDDQRQLKEQLQPIVRDVVSATTPGSPLRRRAAGDHAQALLNKKVRVLVEKPDQPSNADTVAVKPVKPKRTRKKGGEA